MDQVSDVEAKRIGTAVKREVTTDADRAPTRAAHAGPTSGTHHHAMRAMPFEGGAGAAVSQSIDPIRTRPPRTRRWV